MKTKIDKHINITVDDQQFISDIKAIVFTARQKAYQAANLYQVASNWLIGKRIVEQEQHGHARAQYGKRVIQVASETLTAEFGKGYGESTLRNFRKFYLTFSMLQIQQPLLAEFNNPTIGLLLCSETSKDLARYSILKDSKQLYAAKYLTYLPTKEQLTAEIEHQKEIFELQIGKQQK